MTTTAPEETLDRRPGAKTGAIVIVRHGEPDADRTVKIGWRDYQEWWAHYNRTGLKSNEHPPEKLLELGRTSHLIFASTLPRAIRTAEAVACGRDVITDPVFVEAPLPPPPMWGKRTPRAWGVWSRIFWWMGRNDGEESRGHAELRAEAAVATLTARALRGENVMLCAHGWFNRMMRPVLKRQGWRCIYDGGDGYWAYRVYEKRQ
ncbi:MAG: histidine phosphatase family protein [Terricaulis silvestris]